MSQYVMEHKKIMRAGVGLGGRALAFNIIILHLLMLCVVSAQANVLTDIRYSALSGGAAQLTLEMEEPAEEPMIFTIDNPARIAVDMGGTQNALAEKSKRVSAGVVTGYSSAEAKGRTRLVINLTEMTTYEAKVNDNQIVILLGGAETTVVDTSSSPVIKKASAEDGAIRNIDFRRGEKGEGLIQVVLPDPKTVVDMRQEGEKVIVEFMGVSLPMALQQSLDVKDFATPVQTIDSYNKGSNARMEIVIGGEYEQLAYQSNEQLIIEVKPVTEISAEEIKKKKGYTGEKLSLNFQDIEVRAVLQLLADFTGLNVVVSDTVGGSLTLRLKSVPWDQALDIILKTKGLAKRQTGNVMLIAPAAEIANQERLELEASQQISELEPLQTEYVRINYANASDFVTLISSDGNSLLSERGSVSVDDRTNTLLIRETASNIENIRRLINELDTPVRQVLIESRVVSAGDNFTKSLGVRFGVEKVDTVHENDRGHSVPFDSDNDTGYVVGGALSSTTTSGPDATFGNNLMVDLPAALAGGNIALAIGKISNYMLELELQASQLDGTSEIISSPRLVTSDKTQATISDGFQIPYQEASASGATATSWRDATLSLAVTPQITPDDRVIMDLTVTNDRPEAGGAIRTQAVTTQVSVDNGETVVLGGVFSRDRSSAVQRVPFFSDIPYVGWAFRNKTETDTKTELLIFVTPKILNEASSLN